MLIDIISCMPVRLCVSSLLCVYCFRLALLTFEIPSTILHRPKYDTYSDYISEKNDSMNHKVCVDSLFTRK